MKVSEEGENVLKLHGMFSMVEGGMNSDQEAYLVKLRVEKAKDEQ